jgi:hypothetical protein
MTSSPPPRAECLPRFGTPRDYSRKTVGGRWAKVAKALGKPMMPWQRHVANVAGEIDPETGDLYYGEVVVTVPRQSGKTTLILPVAVDRCIVPWRMGPQRSVYTAQSRNDARKKLVEEHIPLLEESFLWGLHRSKRLANGSESVLWRNGSRQALMATTKKSGHGPTIDQAFLDEFFAQVDDRLEQAVRPSMITRASSQLWVVSTAGDASSIPLRRKVDRGRERSLEALRSGDVRAHGRIAYFEYSAPDDADPAAPATWWSCMPALGHTVTEAAVEVEREGMEDDEFRRAFLNQWRDGMVAVQAIPAEDWKACADGPDPATGYAGATLDGRVAFALDITPDSSWGSIAVAGRTADGHPSGHVIEHRPGTSWMVPRIVELAGRWKPLAVTLDPASPASALLNDLVRERVEPLLMVNTREYAAACVALYNAATHQPSEGGVLLPPVFRHRDQAVLNAALAGAGKRGLGDGGWAWNRRTSTTDISPLVAVTLASWAHEREAMKVVDLLQTIW